MDDEVGLLAVEDLLHQLDGAPLDPLVVLGVVELDDLERAVACEPQRPVLVRRARGGRTGERTAPPSASAAVPGTLTAAGHEQPSRR
ncbi:hypothetical protein [Jiangella muralis]|uniref:hypothetical protein n=1 Tax=Jiangella muralis TaxID=702383 RepID=UPI000A40CA3F|nr:hypothetical protein [Jiangella muralis]